MTTVAIMQPTYLPWLGYFELIARSDVFVFLDVVQFEKQSWQSRNRLKGSNGEPFWLSIPIASHPVDTLIKDVELASPLTYDWRRKHIASIAASLNRAPFYSEIASGLEAWYRKDHKYLSDFNIEIVTGIAERLGSSSRFVRASSLDVKGKRTDLLLEICQAVRATRYYSPAGARAYLDGEQEVLTSAGIEVTYQQFDHPVYEQRFGEFVSHLSIVDVIANVGLSKTGEFLGLNAGYAHEEIRP
jgi:hypothetical protein